MAEDQVVERKLAVIFAADVAEYSRLMGLDEVGTLRTAAGLPDDPRSADRRPSRPDLQYRRRQRCRRFCQRGRRRRMRRRGPGGHRKRERGAPAGEQMRFRIGIHLGDVIVEGTNLFGDGVNIAARLQALAEPGGICLSGAVRDQIGSRLPIAVDLSRRAAGQKHRRAGARLQGRRSCPAERGRRCPAAADGPRSAPSCSLPRSWLLIAAAGAGMVAVARPAIRTAAAQAELTSAAVQPAFRAAVVDRRAARSPISATIRSRSISRTASPRI